MTRVSKLAVDRGQACGLVGTRQIESRISVHRLDGTDKLIRVVTEAGITDFVLDASQSRFFARELLLGERAARPAKGRRRA